ncbi:MAG: nucleotidyltransferase domain-containing protein [Microcoleus sp. PH2017_10_PVI_O_A]|uniref:nucleotidyltransferase domain-containing protein n=1 Tax=unclassified Microcoleus TaxID=2642155 RepID=UPI001DACE2BB|nr:MULTISPECIES: nucleotidyltransferase domain-containing protein [unclassified Microcoleus]TAE79274.1 MAG: nucleotidyltransferase domain-containing protein [Oscillatoriales cyanobacterium]MCC3408434.1 nucleotidyltransferase domain-containing protein [Microcoleus sp. PH2017_10_PVI_O_A]MCC3462526.1 nucleotidyltransferase domain-containing protein [Microcoleus sp. PH2017_11_PCY_U_A]MCC3480941.1 nucleotidyltransferase domain-containing protein [Microcoleus sp. PH2017_12_PCY_D_A]MCC3531502.1 nucle
MQLEECFNFKQRDDILVKETRIKRREIMQLSQAIVNEFQPKKIILFGSYAYGNPQDDSDVDLLVILPYEGSSFRKAWEILNKLQPKFAIDLLVRSPVEVEQRLGWNDFFMREIIEKGKVIYESANS